MYRLGNIDSIYSVSDVEEYVKSLGVRVLTCFELKNESRQQSDNKSFRLCIVDVDKDKLFNSDSWSVGVSLREWFHKPKRESNPLSELIDHNQESDAMLVEAVSGVVLNEPAVVLLPGEGTPI